MITSFSSSNFDSARVSAKLGMSVRKRLSLRELLPVAGYRTGTRKRPWREPPFDVIRSTLPARTSFRNTGLYGMSSRGGSERERDAIQ
jgi:hypothetical protein